MKSVKRAQRVRLNTAVNTELGQLPANTRGIVVHSDRNHGVKITLSDRNLPDEQNGKKVYIPRKYLMKTHPGAPVTKIIG